MATQFIHGMAVDIAGEGDAVLCIHGLGGSSNVWTPIAGALQSFQRIAPDLPGSARSALPAGALSVEGLADSMAALARALGLKSVHIVAHSLGTIVAQHLAVAQPELVRSLALFGPLVAPPDAARPNIRARAALARQGAAAMQDIADAIVQGATGKETRAERPVVLAAVRELIMRQPPEGYAQSCGALAAAQSAALEAIDVPVLLVTGDQDGVAPAPSVQAMAQRLARASVVVLPGCGHWTTLEQPERCAHELQAFHARLR
ncbi:alpha/beta fold hydrolase [Pseudorhodoferax soli]|uniref:Pimeloyl-ACP methyl ester carboxylesterase n=1 Tax=Pseudorhodoferax soli TaxID=545864 RepID=A0A368YBD4_9BURK|nr:alpha/beta hydrolase [Pseudorhodoferax soli]RCW76646.1 pimeloyl-ACP methyl ester carboxylesterase [Pseudorhodoferax soli]